LTAGRFIYFEIGNEENLRDKTYYGPSSTNNNYPPIFKAAAVGLHDAIVKQKIAVGYRILTSGPIEPSAIPSNKKGFCSDYTGNDTGVFNHDISLQAIGQAKGAGTTPVLQDTQLGYAVHPYNYSTYNPRTDTATTGYWQNFYHEYGVTFLDPAGHGTYTRYNFYGGICRDLQSMIDVWTMPQYNRGKRLPLVFTEDNWSDHPNDPVIDDGHSIQFCSYANGCEGAYIVDLFTWLYGHRGQYNTTNAPNSQLRVAIYRGANKPLTSNSADILVLQREVRRSRIKETERAG